ncbi:MAG: OmpA family protein [Hydrogenophaga sp.]|uniref:OmpA family protein n=1 Tax=Hydrogenophaga sp. TaxID=1904254 RepID=UPI002717B18B|nr:OmpA family protein [Hydrogenophaga sp.]MDO9030564.1 OmpA family protein [Hydrogenophaga sp.]
MPIRHTLTGLSLAVIAWLTACAPTTRVTLLPQASGKASAVEVSTSKGSQRIDQPYQVAEVGRSGDLSLATTTAEAVRERHPQLLALQPPTAERFTLEFDPGTSALTPESLTRLEAVIRNAQSRSGGEIIVTGHTDRQGPLEANDALSLERAQAVRALLVERGFNAERIEAVGRGEREPLVPTDDEVVEPRNRRADIEVR